MRHGFFLRVGLACVLGVSMTQCPRLPAQTATNSPIPPLTETNQSKLAGPPQPPVPKSPVDFFRELLAMSAAEREKFLANRSPENRQNILAKLRTYESFTPEERELRLRTTELHWYLLPLMNAAPSNRVDQLNMIPEPTRKLVEDRLQLWNLFPPPMQQEFCDNELAMQYIVRLASSTPAEQAALRASLSPEQRKKLEALEALEPEQRRRMTESFSQFFDLKPREKEKILDRFPESERLQMEKTLQMFAMLPKAQRDQCISAFGKFAGMTAEKQQQFLKNAERWQSMLPSERQAWRDLVRNLQLPPMPPGLEYPPMPPLPPGLTVPVAATTNNR